MLPGALIAVIVGIFLNQLFNSFAPGLALDQKHLVDMPNFLEKGSGLSPCLIFRAWTIRPSIPPHSQ